MKSKIAAAFAALSTLAAAGAAQAAVIYDNFTRSEYHANISNYGYTAVFQSNIDQTINQIGSRLRGGESDVKFVVIDLGNGDTPNSTGQTVFSDVSHVAAGEGYDWFYSDLFSLNLNAGRWYAVGAVGAPGSPLYVSGDYESPISPGPTFTAYSNRNMNVMSYDDTNANLGFACCNFHTRLLTNDGVGAVPEPATWALMILGFGSAGAILRRTRFAAA